MVLGQRRSMTDWPVVAIRDVVLGVSTLVAAVQCLALLPWLHERNALAGILGLVAGIAELLWYDSRMAVGFLKAGFFIFLIGVPLAPEVVDHRTWYALQPLVTYAAAQAGVVLVSVGSRWMGKHVR